VSEQPSGVAVPPDRVVAVLTRTELGRSMWMASYFEALSELQAERIEQLERQKSPATTTDKE
jgi:hypothetical protein